jgi:predicted regulator of Ras-like GTPase activity (Roadblock/LC7/MglB family)
MSARWLREITDIAGVEGVLLVSSNGEFIEKIGIQMERSILAEISRNILRMIAIHARIHEELSEIEFAWDNYRILALSTGAFVLIIVCDSVKAISLLRITMNVVAAHLMDDKKTMKKIKKSGLNYGSVLNERVLSELEIKLISKLQ